MPPKFVEKIGLITRIWRKKCFFIVWQLSTLVHIKMSVSSRTELHTPCQTLSFSTLRKEQHLFKSVTRLNPVFQPILTVTIVTVNRGWNPGFSLVTDLNKGCSLLTILKPIACRGVCSSVRLYIAKVYFSAKNCTYFMGIRDHQMSYTRIFRT